MVYLAFASTEPNIFGEMPIPAYYNATRQAPLSSALLPEWPVAIGRK